MRLSITSNVPVVRQGLENLAKEMPTIGRRRMYDMMNRITRRMEEYPEERPYQTYIRTGNLGAAWQVVKLDKGYRVKNDVPYGKYVVGSAYGTGQAWMHVGRWQLLRDVVEDENKKLPEEIRDEIKLVARRNNVVVK
jgi:hypothetical protein